MYRCKAAYIFLTVCVAVLTLLSCPVADGPPGGNGLAPGMDLEPKQITFIVDYIADGQPLAITLPIENKAADTVTADFVVHFYLSTDATFDAAAPDVDLGTVNVATDIAGSTTVNINPSLAMPEVVVNQCVYIYAVVDSTDVVAENDEGNNQSTVAAAAVILVYNNENGARTYTLFFETYPPTGTIIGTDPDTDMTLYDNIGTQIFYITGAAGPGDYEQWTESNINPGTYWILIYPGGALSGPYAFSVRTANIAQKTFGADLASNGVDPGEPDNDPPLPPVTNWVDIKVGAESNRYSGLNDADWFNFVLP